MRKLFYGSIRLRLAAIVILLAGVMALGCQHMPMKDNAQPYALVVHGGAGTILKENMAPGQEEEYRAKLSEALKAGYAVLQNDGSSLDAVQAAINIMEDSPLFNAGKGAVFTHAGTNELDSSIMDGKTLNAGAVAGVKNVKNPINLARLVMDKSVHVMMSGEGAETFARDNGLELVSPDYYFTEFRWGQLQEALKAEADKDDSSGAGMAKENESAWPDHKYGTVGCAALDKAGNLAAGTSTGGMTNKRFGRVGDAPIIGAGTYANNQTCAISATGHGEYFIRSVLTHDISALMEYKKMSLTKAAEHVIMDKLVKLGGTGGVIAIDKNANIAMPFNTPGMYRGYIDKNGKMVVKIYKD